MHVCGQYGRIRGQEYWIAHDMDPHRSTWRYHPIRRPSRAHFRQLIQKICVHLLYKCANKTQHMFLILKINNLKLYILIKPHFRGGFKIYLIYFLGYKIKLLERILLCVSEKVLRSSIVTSLLGLFELSFYFCIHVCKKVLVNHQNVLAPCIYYLYRSSDDTCVYMYKGGGHLRWHWGVSRWAAYSKKDVIPSALVKTPTLAFTHKEWNMEEGICFVNLAVVRAVCIIQKIIADIITLIESYAINCLKNNS